MQLREVLQKPDFTGMAFTGVRGDESLSRSEYDAISMEVSILGNIAAILFWNGTRQNFFYTYMKMA